MKGTVTRSTGSWYEVLAEDRTTYNCRLRGKFRLDDNKESNPIAVGDRVVFETEKDNSVIVEVLPRTNHMLRQSVKKTGHSHVLAANIDQAMIIATLKQPRTSLGFIDRFLASAESFRIPQVLVFNKADLLTEDEQADVAEIMEIYKSIGIAVLLISAAEGKGIDELKEFLQGKTTLIAGHSGVGKSTVLNKIAPHIQQTTGDISSFSNKGTHTTTFAEMFPLNENTNIIDTPGVKEWGLVDMTQQEISDYFPELRELRNECKFGSRCLHLHEPQCAVLDAVEAGTISESRYDSYVSMVEGHDNRK